MQPGKTIEDFFHAAAPYIGPMFAPHWSDLENHREKGVRVVDLPLVRSLHVASYQPFPVALFGLPGTPFLSICQAINAASSSRLQPIHTVNPVPGSTREFVEEFCRAKRAGTYAIGLSDLLHDSLEFGRAVKEAADKHWRGSTGVKLILYAPVRESALPEEWKPFFEKPGEILTVDIPPIAERWTCITPWILYFLAKHDPEFSSWLSRVLPLSEFSLFYSLASVGQEEGVEFGVRATLAHAFAGHGRLTPEETKDLVLQGVAQARSTLLEAATKYLPGKHVATLSGVFDRAVAEPFDVRMGIANREQNLNPKWLVYVGTGDPYVPDGRLSWVEAKAVLGIHVKLALESLHAYIPLKTRPTSDSVSQSPTYPNVEPPRGSFYYTEDCHLVNYDGTWLRPPDKARKLLSIMVDRFTQAGEVSFADELLAVEADLPGQTSGARPVRVDDWLRKGKLWQSRPGHIAILGRDKAKRGHITLFLKPVRFDPNKSHQT